MHYKSSGSYSDQTCDSDIQELPSIRECDQQLKTPMPHCRHDVILWHHTSFQFRVLPEIQDNHGCKQGHHKYKNDGCCKRPYISAFWCLLWFCSSIAITACWSPAISLISSNQFYCVLHIVSDSDSGYGLRLMMDFWHKTEQLRWFCFWRHTEYERYLTEMLYFANSFMHCLPVSDT